MGWKNIKEHYRIGHIVAVENGNIIIGSGYVHDLLTVTKDGQLKWGALSPSKNDDLARYHAEMSADVEKLKELISAPDTFKCAKPVYTYAGGEIIETFCEEYGWPNVTHDGQIMYENTFSSDKAKVVKWAKRNAELGAEWRADRLAEISHDLARIAGDYEKSKKELEKLNDDYPES
jgi:hypothetical protein